MFQFFKSLFDFLFSLSLIFLLFPLFLLIIFILLFFSDSKVFFIHKRIGKDGKNFNLYKFRSMRHSRNEILSKYFQENPIEKIYWQKNQKLKNDPRVTKIGYFLREFSLDELPQIFNILKGDMSFIGPRPIVEDELHKYGCKFEDYKSVKPGLSGLWQVSGRNNTSYKDRVELDCRYIKNMSFLLDIKIFFKTIYVVFSREGAY